MDSRQLGHGLPQSRREFMAQGLLGLGTFISLPTLIPEWAWATASSGISTKVHIPFITWDLVGGAAMPGNFLVGKKGGSEDLLASYSKMGWNPRQDGFDKRFGLPMAPVSVSGILRGLTETLSPDAQANLRLGSFCHQSQDDSNSNTTSAIIEISRAGLEGTLYRQGLGSRPSDSGGNTGTPTSVSTLRPMRIERTSDLETAWLPNFQDTGREQLRRITRSAFNLSQLQLEYLAKQKPNAPTLNEATDRFRESYKKIWIRSMMGSPDTDAGNDPIFQKIFKLTDQDNEQRRLASIVRMVLLGKSGPACIEIPGCDYHDGTSATGDAVDLRIGQSIGASIEAAHQLKKPFFFQVLTDGGVYPEEGTRFWRGDDGLKSMTIIGYYRPEGAPEQIRTQVGAYTDGQGADLTTPVARNTSQVAYAVLANYLNIHGQLGRYEKLTPAGRTFTSKELDDVLIFGGG